MSAIRVAVADDQVLFCSGMQMLIESQSDLEFAGAAHNGDDAVELAEREHPDVMLMDIRMPGSTESRPQPGSSPAADPSEPPPRSSC